jgi:VanZ family protein
LAWDKLQHAGAYALLTLLFGRFFVLWQPLSRHSWRSAWLVAVVFGGLIEILQGTLSDVRQAEWGDLMANAIGATLVVVIANARECRLRRQSTSR